MIGRVQLVVASWPLSPFEEGRPGDQALAQHLLGHLPASPAILIDGVPFPRGPVVRDREIPDPKFRQVRLGADLFYAADLRELEVKAKADAPLTHHALESLKRRYLTSEVIRLPDLLPPEWLVEAHSKFPHVNLIGAEEKRRLRRILLTPLPRAMDFDPQRLTVTEPPNVPFEAGEMTAEQLAEAVVDGEPPFHFPRPPEGVEVVTVTPVDEQGRTLGGSIPDDLWRIFLDAEGAEDLHERLGVADTFCYRFEGRDVRHLLHLVGVRDAGELGWEEPQGHRGYCDRRCLEEQDAMREWIDREEWRQDWGSAVAQERLIGAHEVTVSDSSSWEAIRAGHAGTIENEVVRLGERLGIQAKTLKEVYSNPRFRETVSRPLAIQRIWGFLPLMWMQLTTSIEREHLPAHCRRCGEFITKTKATKAYCSREENPDCWKDGMRERQAARRSRKRGPQPLE